MNILPPLLWLGIGGFLRLFDFGKWTIPTAAWLAPVFLLHFTRTNDPLTATIAIWLALFLATYVANRGVIPVPGIAYPIITAFIGLAFTLPYLGDRLLAARLPGLASTLVFPLAWVVVEFISARTNPFGSWGSIAYTQFGNHSLMQLASVTGIWGITFLIAWFGSTVNWIWDNQFEGEVVQTGFLAYGATWSLVILAGEARLVFSRLARTVRIAVIGWPDGILEPDKIMGVFDSQRPDREREPLRKAFRELQDYFLEESKREARAGAKIVVWPEASLMMFQEDEASFMERAKQLAREERTYLLMGMATIRLGDSRPVENKAVLINSSGEIAYSYIKSRPVPGWEARINVPGDGRILTHNSQHGRVASAICYDMDFPQLIRQVGDARIDTILVPASDWQTIKQLHHVLATFRAIENGVSMVRAARWGLSAAVDPLGRTVATMDHFSTARRAMIAYIPIAGVRTVYARIGDLFAWLCVAGLLGTVVWGVR